MKQWPNIMPTIDAKINLWQRDFDSYTNQIEQITLDENKKNNPVYKQKLANLQEIKDRVSVILDEWKLAKEYLLNVSSKVYEIEDLND
jgi:hypothetical protein